MSSVKTLALNLIEKKQGHIEAYPLIQTEVRAKKGLTQQDLTQAIYAKMTSHQFCRQRPQDKDAFCAIIRQAIEQNKPIACVVGHGPLKNSNNSSHPYADWAEFYTYVQLIQLASAVKRIYEPGLSIELYLDDARAAYANQVSAALMTLYRESVQEMVLQCGFQALIHQVVSLNDLYPQFQHQNYLTEAESRVKHQHADANYQEQWAAQILHASRNTPNRDQYSETELWHEAQQAAYRYLLYYEAENLCGIWNQPDKLYLRYSPHAGFYQIFTLRKGSVSQPWQGEGALLALENNKLDPFIMTRSKSQRYQHIETVQLDSSVVGLQSLPILQEVRTPLPTACSI